MSKTKQQVCDSCNKIIVGEPMVVELTQGHSQLYSGKFKSQMFHKSPIDCANADSNDMIWFHNPLWKGRGADG